MPGGKLGSPTPATVALAAAAAAATMAWGRSPPASAPPRKGREAAMADRARPVLSAWPASAPAPASVGKAASAALASAPPPAPPFLAPFLAIAHSAEREGKGKGDRDGSEAGLDAGRCVVLRRRGRSQSISAGQISARGGSVLPPYVCFCAILLAEADGGDAGVVRSHRSSGSWVVGSGAGPKGGGADACRGGYSVILFYAYIILSYESYYTYELLSILCIRA